MIKRILFMISCIMLLSASACDPKKPDYKPEDQVIVPRKDEVVISKFLLEDCPPLEPFDVREYTEGETLSHLNKWTTAYKLCATKHKKQSDLVRKAFNITENQSSK